MLPLLLWVSGLNDKWCGHPKHGLGFCFSKRHKFCLVFAIAPDGTEQQLLGCSCYKPFGTCWLTILWFHSVTPGVGGWGGKASLHSEHTLHPTMRNKPTFSFGLQKSSYPPDLETKAHGRKGAFVLTYDWHVCLWRNTWCKERAHVLNFILKSKKSVFC